MGLAFGQESLHHVSQTWERLIFLNMHAAIVDAVERGGDLLGLAYEIRVQGADHRRRAAPVL